MSSSTRTDRFAAEPPSRIKPVSPEVLTFIYFLSDPRFPDVPKYVGKSVNVQVRLNNHCKPANSNQAGRLLKPWLESLRSEGLKPMLSVIDSADGSDWMLLEQYWISQMRSWGFSLLNVTAGGDRGSSGWHHTEEDRRLMSARQTGKPLNEEWKRNIAKANTGKKLKPETVEKLRNTKKHRTYSAVVQLTQSGQRIAEFASVGDANAAMGVGRKSGRVGVGCNNPTKVVYGHHWAYKGR